MEYSFFNITGWVFGLISTVIAVIQFFQNKNLKKKLTILEQKNTKGGTGYQANTMHIQQK